MMAQDFYSETACANCGGVIEAGEYRVLVTAVELKPEGFDEDGVEVPASRGESTTQYYCDCCVATLPRLVPNGIENPWKELSDDLAQASAGPSTEDASKRFVHETDAANAIAAKSRRLGRPISAGQAEALLYSTSSPDRPGREQPPDKTDQQERLREFLKSPGSRKMLPQMRRAATMCAEGASQSEIARKLGVDQSTVSRMVKGAMQMAFVQR